MRIGYLECFSGISGDMLLGALVDAGVPFDVLAETAGALGVGARLEMRKVDRGGLAGIKVDVVVQGPREQGNKGTESQGAREQGSEGAGPAHLHSHSHSEPHSHSHESHDHEHHSREADSEDGPGHQHAHRSLSTILAIIQAAPLKETVKLRASRAFQLLGEAEAAIHSIPIEKVHFHEVGAVDTIIDIVCAAAGAETLGVDRWMASPLNVGSGTVKCQHGTLPVPAPATLSLLGDAPVYAAGPPMERVTPTGAVLLRMLDVQYGPLPAMRVSARGYGAGGRDTPGEPNLLRLLVGDAEPIAAPEAKPITEIDAEPIAVIEAVIDDSTPQLLAYVSELLLEAGAWDVYRAAVQMKKGRTGVQMTVLASEEKLPALRDLLLSETTTIGLRWRLENKMALEREFAEVDTEWGKVRIKVARWPSGEVANASPEYEVCRNLARTHKVPLKQVMQEAMRAWAERTKEL
ncbi:MAG: nickel pincer cofactor biosynthesis protein LarC [Terracidiphilus sp.]|nr:nickel pincer cofactor biosynthesis protein LarC [Terracidiphilus sp.]MDR3799115.1 nickel pincer cofactor biosynthesis protein LarC [Terracidiphilus sp.]